MISHPFEGVAPGRHRWRFALLLGLTLAILLLFRLIDPPLRTAVAPSGVVSFELAGDLATARAIVEAWDVTARVYAAFGLGFDFLFLVAYSTTLSWVCVWAAQRLRRRGWHGLGDLLLLLAWGQWLAAIFDAAENSALLLLLLGNLSDPLPVIAWWCATLKFLLIGLGLLAIAAAALLPKRA